ncbi:Conidiophore development regulator abaA [Apiospora marii]|uniref:Conidiophore development regulator abaA n=1 Tax=Apiospora marii TaxID=335849 RepID=UPI00312F0950
MDKRKYNSRDTLYGRNMLISEYLWICHWILYPPNPGEEIPMGKDREKRPGHPAHPKYRTRKQVSSHIQVLKELFKTLPLLHFFFPRKNDEDDVDGRLGEGGQTKPIQHGSVLAALAEGLLPQERPNYAYFAHLLAADDEVFLRPETCHIYTSHSELTLSEDFGKAFTADGTCLHADAYAPDGTRLELQGDFPHLRKNRKRAFHHDVHHGDRDEPRTYLLHEYTESITQTESNSVRGISAKWDHQFPKLREKLRSALDDPHTGTARSVMGPCDIIHMKVVLDLHGTGHFPIGTHLDGCVEFNVSRLELAHHMWRCSTCVVKPRELYLNASDPLLWDYKSTCRPSRRGNTIEVPFPAASWASTFYRLSEYVTAERERKEGKRMETVLEQRAQRECSNHGADLPTPSDMLQQIAMYQEIFSAPSEGSSKPVWKRRCVLLWTFSDIRDKAERVRGKQPKKETRETAGTTWRFLSKLDPTSQYHQQRAYLPGSPNVPSIITPNVGSQHHLGAVMHTNSGSFYDVANLDPPYQLQETNIHPTNLNMLGGISNGLTAPLPTSYLHSSYGQSCGSSIIENDDSLKPQNSYTSDGPTGDTAALMSVHGRKRVCVLGLGHYVFAWQRVMVEMGPGMEEERETGAKVYLGLTVIVATLPPREEHRPTTMVGEKRKRTPDDSSESLAPGDEGYVELDLDLDHFKRARRERGYSQSTTRRHRGFRPELYGWIPRRALNAGY